MIYFFVTFPFVLFLSYITWDATVEKEFHYKLWEMPSADVYCKEKGDQICIRSNEIASLIKGYAELNWYNRDNLNSPKDILTAFLDSNPDSVDYLSEEFINYSHSENHYRYENIENFAKRNNFWERRYNYNKGILYIIYIIIWYILVTDLLRWAAYYIDSWKYKLYILSKIKSIFTKK